MKKKKKYDDDDGRVIADMGNIEVPHIEMSNKDRRIWIFAALKAGLLVALIYIISAVLLIGLIILLGYSAIR